MRKHLNKKIAAVALGAIAVSGTGVAYAYWTTTGAGTGSATAGTDAPGDAVKLVQVGTLTGVYPGGSAKTVSVQAENPAAFDQAVGNVTVTVEDVPGCDAGNWKVTETPDTLGIVTAGATSMPKVVASVQLLETGANQDGCKLAEPVLTFVSASSK